MILYFYMAGVVMSGASATINTAAADSYCSKPLDLCITGIDYHQSYLSLECMGEKGRSAYQQIETRQDVIYPIVYGLLFLFTLLCLSSYCTENKVVIVSCSVLPFVIVASDFLENHFIVKLIGEFPNLNPDTVNKLSVFNSAKWILFFIAGASIIFFAGWSLIKLLKTTSKKVKSR